MSSPRPTLEWTVAPEKARSKRTSSGRTRCRAGLHETRDRRRASRHSSRSASPRTLRKCKPPELHLGETALSALTPTLHLRPVAGARRAIPRTIHGVRLAITSTARSERRIAVRRPGVGIDASSASGDPARGPWRSTASNSESNTRRQRIDPRLAAAGWSARPFDHAYLVRARASSSSGSACTRSSTTLGKARSFWVEFFANDVADCLEHIADWDVLLLELQVAPVGLVMGVKPLIQGGF